MDFLIQFLSTFRPEGFYSLFCGPVLRRLHGHVRPLLLMVGWLVRLSPRRGEPPYQQGTACPAYTGRRGFLSLPTWQTTPPLLQVCCVIHIPPLPSSVNHLFRLFPVSIKRDRAPGSTVRDGRTFRADCRMAESAHAFIDTLSKAIWIRRRGYRAVPNQGQPHPGEIVLLLLLRKNRFLMRLAGFGVCDGRSVPRTGPQRQGRSSPTPA